MDTNLLETYCPTYEALSIIYSAMESDSETFKSYVRAGYLMESGASKDIVMEGVGDIFKTIAEGFKKFIQKVKDFFKKILLYITASFGELDKFADEVKDVIKDTDVNFTVYGYKFTVLDKPAPNMTEFQNLVNTYNDDMEKISDLKETEIKKQIMDWMSETHLDGLRAEVLGISGKIAEDEYLDKVRSFYRNGETATTEIEVNKSYVTDIISHAKRLEDLKKSSIKDRDKLITLLTKTETFFGRTIYTYYKGDNKQINVNKVDTSDDKFSTKDNYVTVNDNLSKIISMYATYKSKQVNKIASMVNTVACERVNALKDQIKQERTILKKCLFGNEAKSEVKESVDIFPDTGYNGCDYSVLAMESSIADYSDFDKLSRKVLLEEADFLLSSMKTGEVQYFMEADTATLGNKVRNGIAELIEAIAKTFRQKAIGNVERYKPWIDEIEPGIKEKAKNHKGITVAGFVDADYANMSKDIQNAINIAYKSDDYNNVSFATKILNTITDREKLKDPDNRGRLLNYFRTGKADEKLATKTLSGNDLVAKIDTMITYISSYDKTVTTQLDAISKSLDTSSKAFKVQESMITGNTYLDIISAPICESDIVLCKDYNHMFSKVMEEAKIGGDNKSAIAGEANKAVKAGAKAADAETKNGEELKSATSVQSEGSGEDGIAEKKTNNEAVAYKKDIDAFFKQCISLYAKAREEQFIAYVNAISEIDGARPKFDKNGKYISKASKKQEEEEATKAEAK